MSYNILCSFDDDNADDDSLSAFEIDVISRTLDYLGFSDKAVEVSVLFTTVEMIQVLNKQYRSVDKPTNVLSFPNMTCENSLMLLGDIVLSLDVIKREAVEQNKNFYDHLTHLTVHSILHLLGYDHISEEEAEKMESIEIKILYNVFNIQNPYL